MYEPGPAQEELELIGITLDDLGELPPTEVWAENWDAMRVFQSLRTQWLHGMNGPTGLRYEAVWGVADLMLSEGYDKRELFESLQILELAALNIIHKKRK